MSHKHIEMTKIRNCWIVFITIIKTTVRKVVLFFYSDAKKKKKTLGFEFLLLKLDFLRRITVAE